MPVSLVFIRLRAAGKLTLRSCAFASLANGQLDESFRARNIEAQENLLRISRAQQSANKDCSRPHGNMRKP